MGKIENTLTFNEFCERISVRLGIPCYEAEDLIRIVRDEIISILMEKKNLKCVGIGTIGSKKRKGKKYFNKLVQKEIILPDRRTLFFKPSEDLNKKLNEV